MILLIRRKPSTSREELVAHRFANHMPIVIDNQVANADKGRLHARKYIATLFDGDKSGNHPWDGVAQLWWHRALPMPDEPFGLEPSDSFQERAEPYWPWATEEMVVIDGELPAKPLTLYAAPFPQLVAAFSKLPSWWRPKTEPTTTRSFSIGERFTQRTCPT